MKKAFIVIFFVLVTMLFLMLTSNKTIKADNITIYYSFSSYAMFGAEQTVTDDLLNKFNSLKFEETADKIDISSTFYVSFSYKGSAVKSFRVDKNGVFGFSGYQYYRISSGSFDYDYLKKIYEDSKHH